MIIRLIFPRCSQATIRTLKLIRLFLLRVFLLLYFFNLINLEVIFLIWNLLPFRNVHSIVCIDVNFIFTYLLQIRPFLSLLVTHYIPFWLLIVFCLGDTVNETRITCFLTDIDSPHIKLLASRLFSLIVIVRLFSLEILGQ